MSSLLPSPSNGYAVTVNFKISDEVWNEAIPHLAGRVDEIEAVILAGYTAAQQAGTAMAEAIIQNAVAPQIADITETIEGFQTSLALAEDQLAALQNGGVEAVNVPLAPYGMFAPGTDAQEAFNQVSDALEAQGTAITGLGTNKMEKSTRGAANGVAPLDENSEVTRTYLPTIADAQVGDIIPSFGNTAPNAEGVWLPLDGRKYLKSAYPLLAPKVPFSFTLGTEQVVGSGMSGKVIPIRDGVLASVGALAGGVSFYTTSGALIGSRTWNVGATTTFRFACVAGGRLYVQWASGGTAGIYSIPITGDHNTAPTREDVPSGSSYVQWISVIDGKFFALGNNGFYVGPSIASATSRFSVGTGNAKGTIKLPNGNLLTPDSAGLRVSEDGGETWGTQILPGLSVIPYDESHRQDLSVVNGAAFLVLRDSTTSNQRRLGYTKDGNSLESIPASTSSATMVTWRDQIAFVGNTAYIWDAALERPVEVAIPLKPSASAVEGVGGNGFYRVSGGIAITPLDYDPNTEFRLPGRDYSRVGVVTDFVRAA